MGLWGLIKLPFTTTIKSIYLIFSIVQLSIFITWTITRAIPTLIYASSVVLNLAILYITFDESIAFKIQEIVPFAQFPLAVGMTGVTEVPHLFIALRVVGIVLAKVFGILSSWLGFLFLLLDVASIGLYLYSLGLNYQAVEHIAAQFKVSQDTRFSFLSLFSRCITPTYAIKTPSRVGKYAGVSYYSTKDLSSLDSSITRLGVEGICDIYSTESSAAPKPVVIHIHGGGWRRGSKEMPNPTALILAERGFVVVNINYRLVPRYPQPAGLQDVQLAIRWCQEHIEVFGGDPKFIMLSGESAGAHLALTAALRPEGYSIAGLYLLSPALDVLDHVPGRTKQADFFVKTVCHGQQDVADSLAPFKLLEKGAHLPPTIMLHGEPDNLVSCQGTKAFATLGKEKGFTVNLVTLAHTHHLVSITNSMKNIAMAEIVADWGQKLHADCKKSQ